MPVSGLFRRGVTAAPPTGARGSRRQSCKPGSPPPACARPPATRAPSRRTATPARCSCGWSAPRDAARARALRRRCSPWPRSPSGGARSSPSTSSSSGWRCTTSCSRCSTTPGCAGGDRRRAGVEGSAARRGRRARGVRRDPRARLPFRAARRRLARARVRSRRLPLRAHPAGRARRGGRREGDSLRPPPRARPGRRVLPRPARWSSSRVELRRIGWALLGAGAALAVGGLIDLYAVDVEWWRGSGAVGYFRYELGFDYHGPGRPARQLGVQHRGRAVPAARRELRQPARDGVRARRRAALRRDRLAGPPAPAARRRARRASARPRSSSRSRARRCSRSPARSSCWRSRSGAGGRSSPPPSCSRPASASRFAFTSVAPETHFFPEDLPYQEEQARKHGDLPGGSSLALNPGEPSLRSHWQSLRDGIETVFEHPQGYGLGNAGAIAVRFGVPLRAGRVELHGDRRRGRARRRAAAHRVEPRAARRARALGVGRHRRHLPGRRGGRRRRARRRARARRPDRRVRRALARLQPLVALRVACRPVRPGADCYLDCTVGIGLACEIELLVPPSGVSSRRSRPRTARSRTLSQKSFRALGVSADVAQALAARDITHAISHPGARHPGRPHGRRRAREGADRLGQDLRLRPADRRARRCGGADADRARARAHA